MFLGWEVLVFAWDSKLAASESFSEELQAIKKEDSIANIGI